MIKRLLAPERPFGARGLKSFGANPLNSKHKVGDAVGSRLVKEFEGAAGFRAALRLFRKARLNADT